MDPKLATVQSPPKKSTASSWIQLGFFTAFLFLLVAIPYTLYIKAYIPKSTVRIINVPTIQPTIFPTIIPQVNTTTQCFTVPQDYERANTSSSTQSAQTVPMAYLFSDSSLQKTSLCYPPALPPFPFTWQPYTSYQYGYTIDTPSNWLDKTTTIQHTTLHIFAADDTSANPPSVSFTWYPGEDPYATAAAYAQNSVTKDGTSGTVYTKGNTGFVAAVFPIAKGYLLIEASKIDSAFYAFQHMLDSLKFSQ